MLCDAGASEQIGMWELVPNSQPVFDRYMNPSVRALQIGLSQSFFDIPAPLSDVMNQLKKISISLAGFMATPPTPPSKLVSF